MVELCLFGGALDMGATRCCTRSLGSRLPCIPKLAGVTKRAANPSCTTCPVLLVPQGFARLRASLSEEALDYGPAARDVFARLQVSPLLLLCCFTRGQGYISFKLPSPT